MKMGRLLTWGSLFLLGLMLCDGRSPEVRADQPTQDQLARDIFWRWTARSIPH